MNKMLILRGIPGKFKLNGKSIDFPRGALDEGPALEYAMRRGYEPHILDVSGETGHDSAQVHAAIKAIKADPSIRALYGFSGGGYNIRHILNRFDAGRFDLVVVIGAPNVPKSAFTGRVAEVVYRKDPAPPAGHMDGPKALVAELGPVFTPILTKPPKTASWLDWLASFFKRA